MRCLKCQMQLLPDAKICPLCLTPTIAQATSQTSPQTYPSYPEHPFKARSIMRWLFLSLLTGSLICTVVNILTYDPAKGWWVLWVLWGAGFVFTASLMIKRFRVNPVKLLFYLFLLTLTLLAGLDWQGGGQGWSILIVSPILQVVLVVVSIILVLGQHSDNYTLMSYQICYTIISGILVAIALIRRQAPLWLTLISFIILAIALVANLLFEKHSLKQNGQKMFHT
ncbi:hypothetical protein JCM14202_313 [Agrilactobacillus composti DSM 18527 = JCM 14202]|nr:DUF6320 domain-containing protein [Agrilactobacillus composti]GAF38501.1 hypothetical protein JCM14202_313 [Agrilactobacillus composti DSM 18527 = JCM 14202]